eukprot:CAMPEP_0172766426 /NCGR_PEP_ID=MMETSP1074-20121228/181200_1 /TAXON_ID=2916 /ORGANISM="Ceratium fusus, Strain PA161109" /LENGTH=54 /DNA_ID=CAMNT_0013601521 /DNA_START=24 /DNA_END=184 /DNA_ORIENTATION=-
MSRTLTQSSAASRTVAGTGGPASTPIAQEGHTRTRATLGVMRWTQWQWHFIVST